MPNRPIAQAISSGSSLGTAISAMPTSSESPPASEQERVAADQPAQPHGGLDLEEAGDDRPGGQQRQQAEAADPRPRERHDTDDHADDALDEHDPPLLEHVAPDDGHCPQDQPVDEREHAEGDREDRGRLGPATGAP